MSDQSIAVTSITNRNLWIKSSTDLAAGAGAQVVAQRELRMRVAQADLSASGYTYDVGIWNPADSERVVRVYDAILEMFDAAIAAGSDPLPAYQQIKVVKSDAIWGSAAAAARDVVLNGAMTPYTDAGILVKFATDGGGTPVNQFIVRVPTPPLLLMGNGYKLFRMSDYLPYIDIMPGERFSLASGWDWSSGNGTVSVLMGLDQV